MPLALGRGSNDRATVFAGMAARNALSRNLSLGESEHNWRCNDSVTCSGFNSRLLYMPYTAKREGIS